MWPHDFIFDASAVNFEKTEDHQNCNISVVLNKDQFKEIKFHPKKIA